MDIKSTVESMTTPTQSQSLRVSSISSVVSVTSASASASVSASTTTTLQLQTKTQFSVSNTLSSVVPHSSSSSSLPPPPLISTSSTSVAESLPTPKPFYSPSTTASSSNTSAYSRMIQWNQARMNQWCRCPRVSNPIFTIPSGNFFFLVCKAPLSTVYEEQYGGVRNQYTPSMIVQRCISRGVHIAVVVDATMSNRYFHLISDWDDWGCEYWKLGEEERKRKEEQQRREDQTQSQSHLHPSKQKQKHRRRVQVNRPILMPPSRSVIKEFHSKMHQRFPPTDDGSNSNSFSSPHKHANTHTHAHMHAQKNKLPSQAVLIFSELGHHRAGYLVVSYLTQVCRIPLRAALQRFAAARPPGIFSSFCLHHLVASYGGGSAAADATMKAWRVKPPEWDVAMHQYEKDMDRRRQKQRRERVKEGDVVKRKRVVEHANNSTSKKAIVQTQSREQANTAQKREIASEEKEEKKDAMQGNVVIKRARRE